MTTTAEQFELLKGWAADASPLYEHLCEIVVDAPELLRLAGTVPDDRWPPHVFLSAVHYCLLSGTDHPLAEYYPSVTDDPRDPDDALAERFRDFCLSHAEDLLALARTKRTQTNAVRRCGALYPAFAHVAERVDEPMALIELGPSAGLNLLFDRYRYDYGDHGVVGRPNSSVTISTEIRGAETPPLPDRPPQIRSRVGVDLNPLDVTDPADADWLRALTWPEHEERRRLLGGALAVAREDPPHVVEGDMVEQFPSLVRGVPADVPICAFNTLVLYQVPDPVREDVEALVREYAAERPLHWLSGDGDLDRDRDGIPLEWTREIDGEVRTDRLATFQPHGEWLSWCDAGP